MLPVTQDNHMMTMNRSACIGSYSMTWTSLHDLDTSAYISINWITLVTHVVLSNYDVNCTCSKLQNCQLQHLFAQGMPGICCY